MPIDGSEIDDQLFGTPNDDVIRGFGGNDYIEGYEGDDNINGGDGDDFINGGAGIDTLNGGAGNDTIYSGEGVGANSLMVFDNLDGGEGNDTLWLTPDSGTTNYYTVQGGTGNDTIVIEGLNGVNLSLGFHDINQSQNIGAGITLFMSGIENVWGSFGDDYLYGDSGDNIIDGRNGWDYMAGGQGNDTYYVDDIGDYILEIEGEGIDTVYTRGLSTGGGLPAYTLHDNIENATITNESYAELYGNSLNNVLTASGGNAYGMDGNDRLYGGDWSNYLDGGAGVDAMFGGLGDDTYVVDDVRDRVNENADAGFDTVLAWTNYALVRNLERLDLVGTALNGSGNGLDNVVNGNEFNNRLNGFAGSDTLNGGLGNDWLDGGSGADFMFGGAGDDVYTVDNVEDFVQDFDGNDTIRSYVSFTLSPGNCDNIILIGSSAIDASGDNYDNLLRGNIAANILTGNNGNDTLIGDAGNDTLYGGVGVDRLQGGTGIDQLWGGSGADKFVFDDGDIVGATLGSADVIHDFSHAEGDRIYLNLMDANINTVEDDAFTFIGSANFSGTAGELRATQYGADMLVRGDIDGDGNADFMIIVSNTTSLVASDFIF